MITAPLTVPAARAAIIAYWQASARPSFQLCGRQPGNSVYCQYTITIRFSNGSQGSYVEDDTVRLRGVTPVIRCDFGQALPPS